MTCWQSDSGSRLNLSARCSFGYCILVIIWMMMAVIMIVEYISVFKTHLNCQSALKYFVLSKSEAAIGPLWWLVLPSFDDCHEHHECVNRDHQNLDHHPGSLFSLCFPISKRTKPETTLPWLRTIWGTSALRLMRRGYVSECGVAISQICKWSYFAHLLSPWSTVSQTLHEANGPILQRRVGLAFGHGPNASRSSDTCSPEGGVPIPYILIPFIL